MQEALRVDNLMQTNEGAAFLNKMHFSLMKGEVLGIIGLHDSGRSTLVNILCGRLPATGGSIYLEGNQVELHSISQAQERGVMCIREKSTLIPDLSLLENMCLLTQSRMNSFHFPDRNVINSIKFLLKELNIDVDMNCSCRILSLQMRHKLEIVRAFMNGAKVLILHDIMQSYNQEEENDLKDLLQWLRKHNIGVMITGSRPEQMIPVCDRIVVTRAGRDVGLFFRDEFSVEKIEKSLMGTNKEIGVPTQSFCERVLLLRAENICNSQLDEISFEVCEGEIVGFVGKNRSSARGIADLFNGSDPHTKGILTINGKEFPPGRKVVLDQSCRAGYVGEYKKCIFPDLSLKDNLAIASLPLFSKGPTISKNIENVAVSEFSKEYGIDEADLPKRITSFGSFYQMKVCYYRWLLANVRILVLDDVFQGTDVLMRNSLNEFFRLAQKRKMAILLVSSNYSALREVSTRLVCL